MSAADPRAALAAARARHDPVLLDEVLTSLAPAAGETYVDGTLGAGGYARAVLEAANCQVLGIDRDPAARALCAAWAPLYEGRLTIAAGEFGDLDAIAQAHGHESVDGVMLDIGVSSMQIDEAERGFSFMRDGPLDMRMGSDGPSAADLIAETEEAALADILYLYGEERRSRAIARAIVKARAESPIESTARLAKIIESAYPPRRPGDIHPATRSFQALRIAVNDELGQLERGLVAAERLLKPHGRLIVVTFHSLEDRMVKRFFKERSGTAPRPSRHAPDAPMTTPSFELLTRKALAPTDAEVARNARARSAKLRAARRTDAPLRETPQEGRKARGRGR